MLIDNSAKKSNSMVKWAAAAIALASVASATAGAEEMRPIQAKGLHLGDMNGVAYYTVEGQGYHVVATLSRQDGKPVRFESTLSAGQTVVLSTPGSAGVKPQAIEFSRQDNRLLVQAKQLPTD